MAASKGSGRRSGRGAAKAPAPASAPARGAAGPAAKPSKDREIQRLERLLGLMSEHALAELEVRGDGSVRLSKCGPASLSNLGLAMGANFGAPPMASGSVHGAPTPASAPGAVPAVAKSTPAGEPFLSPMVGTFYRASSPEAKPFVMEGDLVKPESVICIIEAMKVLNEIKAEKPGKIVQILVENGEAVEYGQPLFIIQRN